jgi:hypothetical protein
MYAAGYLALRRFNFFIDFSFLRGLVPAQFDQLSLFPSRHGGAALLLITWNWAKVPETKPYRHIATYRTELYAKWRPLL